MNTRVSAISLTFLLLFASSQGSSAQVNESGGKSVGPDGVVRGRDPSVATDFKTQPLLPTPQKVGWCNMAWKFRGPWLPEGSLYQLILAPAVQEELEINEEQKGRLRATKFSRMQSEIDSLNIKIHMKWVAEPFEELRVAGTLRQQDLHRALNSELKKILKADQERRLDEIALQQAGPLVVAHPVISRSLDLSRAQVKKVHELVAEARSKSKSAREQISKEAKILKPVAGPLNENQIEELQTWVNLTRSVADINRRSESELAERILDSLNPSQKKKLDRMLGEPFKLAPLAIASGRAQEAKESKP